MIGGQPTPQAAEDSTAAWEDPPRRPPPSTMPVLSVAGFEGPLDWLLELARAKQIDLSRLSIVALIDSFASALQAALAGQAGSHPVPLALTGDSAKAAADDLLDAAEQVVAVELHPLSWSRGRRCGRKAPGRRRGSRSWRSGGTCP